MTMSYLVANDLVLLLVVQCRNSEAAFILWIHTKVDVPEVCGILVERIRGNVVAWDFLVGFGEAPS